MLNFFNRVCGHPPWPRWDSLRDPLTMVNWPPVRYLRVRCGNISMRPKVRTLTPLHQQDPPNVMDYEWQNDPNHVMTVCQHSQLNSQNGGTVEFARCQHILHDQLPFSQITRRSHWVCNGCAQQNARALSSFLNQWWQYRVVPECRPCSRITWRDRMNNFCTPANPTYPQNMTDPAARQQWLNRRIRRARIRLQNDPVGLRAFYEGEFCKCPLRPIRTTMTMCRDCTCNTLDDMGGRMLWNLRDGDWATISAVDDPQSLRSYVR